MKIIGVLPVRNEDWVLGLSARALLRWVDELVILDHCSTDGTAEIIDDIQEGMLSGESKPVWYTKEENPVWEEMRHRQELLEIARGRCATHIVTIDADEVLSANLVPHIRDIIAEIPEPCVLQLPWITCRDSIQQQHASGLWAEQHASAAFKDEPRCHWMSRAGYDFHQRAPMGRPEIPFKPVTHAGGGILHLQYSNRRRLLAKQYLYGLTEKLRWPGRDTVAEINRRYAYSVYGQATRIDNPNFDLAPVPAEWWAGYEDLMQYLHLDAEPWQEDQCRKILAENPGIEEGLDDFGLLEKLRCDNYNKSA